MLIDKLTRMIRILIISFILLTGSFQSINSQNMNYNCAIKRSQSNTTEKLSHLRAQMKNLGLYAYIVSSEDEYIQEYDTRQAWITGFVGPIDTIVVTLDQAVLWIDRQYWIQAKNELDCANWLLMALGEPDVPTVSDWISKKLKTMSIYNKVGFAAQFISSNLLSSLKYSVTLNDVSFIGMDELIDQIRLMTQSNPVYVHDIKFAGITWENKVEIIAGLIKAESMDGLLIIALDEIAWLFNVRGSDISYSPFFQAYAFVYANQTTHLWMNESQLTIEAKTQLKNVTIRSYGEFLSDLNVIANNSNINKIWITRSVSQSILNNIPVNKRFIAGSPVQRTKAIKNSIEQKGMRDSSIRDSIARVRHLAWLENEVMNDHRVNETQAAERLEFYQSQEDYFKGISFSTISAVGAHAAVIHFEPNATIAARITKDQIYLLDAGAQYLDGTTDVTRTHIFGTSTMEERKAYTLVLQGCIDLADAVFPVGTYGRQLDILARQSLYKNFMDYAHSTGHGIGHFLSIHEGPSFIGMGYSSLDIPLAHGMVFSDEPGFYLPDSFGIRLETHIMVQNYTLEDNYFNSMTQFLHFEPLTFVPFDRNLIVCEMLTKTQLDWLNWYHAKVRNTLESAQRLNADELNYLIKTTEVISC
ncbi:hypothetical protein I4U23_027429 [Adineta vaga]|nr:hypothetical protein I4U23_027429 [Adineta vaga]